MNTVTIFREHTNKVQTIRQVFLIELKKSENPLFFFSVSGVELVGEEQSNRIDFDDEHWNDESADFRLVQKKTVCCNGI